MHKVNGTSTKIGLVDTELATFVQLYRTNEVILYKLYTITGNIDILSDKDFKIWFMTSKR